MSDPASANLVLAFIRGGKTCAIAADAMRGVTPHVRTTRVPGAPRRVIGVINWRGAVLPLVEPVNVIADGHWTAALLVNGEMGDIALAADEVSGWIERRDDLHLIDVDEVQRHVRDRVRRGRESVFPPAIEDER